MSAPASPECPECVRLQEQAGAALLTGDRSRLEEVRRYQRQHLADAHKRAAY
jgi:hypothetical protein